MPEMDNRSEEAEKADKDIEAQPSNEESEKDTLFKAEQAELSRKAQQMGEQRKRMAETLIGLAKSNDAAREQLRTLTENESERAYFEKKFGDEFTSLFSEEPAAKEEPAAPSAEMEAVKALLKERALEKKARTDKFKESLGLTLSQADQFDDLVATLEGKELGGKAITHEVAVEMAAKQIRPDAQISFSGRGDVVERPEDKKDEVKINIRPESIRRYGRHTKAESAEDYVPIEKQVAETGRFKLQG